MSSVIFSSLKDVVYMSKPFF